MNSPGVKDTSAYRVIKQVIDHTWSIDEELSDEDVVSICHDFSSNGGVWKELLDGDVRHHEILENTIEVILDRKAMQEGGLVATAAVTVMKYYDKV